MDIKNILTIIGASLLSSLLAVGIYAYMDGNNKVESSNDSPARYVNYNSNTNVEPKSKSPVPFSAEPSGVSDHTSTANTLNDRPGEFTSAANISKPCVVHITGRQKSNSGYEDLFGWGGLNASSGSGVIVSKDGYIVTNNHVIENTTELEVILDDRRSYSAKIIGTDPTTDLALIKVNEKELDGVDLPSIKFGDSDAAEVGQWVLAVGNPFNLTSTVTAGIVSAKGRNIDILQGTYKIESFIQTDAAVNPGNSGGALVNTNGELVGINTAIITRSGRYEGYSFAVPSNLVNKVIRDIQEYGSVQRGFLGVMINDVTKEIVARHNLKNMEGIYIDQVNPGSAAEEAGLKSGDVIININGIKVKTTPELQEQVALFRPGSKLDIKYIRDGKPSSAKVILKDKNNKTKTSTRKSKVGGNIDLADFGVKLRELNTDESKRLKSGGVMVVSITEGSIIDKTNMDPGFIITKVNGQLVKDANDVKAAIANSKDKVVLDGFYEAYNGSYNYVFEK